ncbi:hypothetical protein [Streptomyces sp. NPDC001275]
MATPPPHCERACMSAEAVNDAIRRLMDEPSTPQRAEAYRRLLEVWTDVADDHADAA